MCCCCSKYRANCCKDYKCCDNIFKYWARACPCCLRYFPEWQLGPSWIIFLIRTFFVLAFSTLMVIFHYLWSERAFDTSPITWGSMFVVAIFFTHSVMLVLLYGPHLLQVYPWWLSLLISLIYAGLGFYLVIEQLIKGNLQQFETDSISFDIWTVVHFWAGPFFALFLPFLWMFLIVAGWEVMEAYTKGFGESESLGNRAIDIGVAVIGWWIVILIFKRTRQDIPWISAMNAAGNNGAEIDWIKVLNKILCKCCPKIEKDDHETVAAEQMENNQTLEAGATYETMEAGATV
eukprot:19088_1